MFNLPIKRKRDTVGEWNEGIITIKGVISIFQIGMDYIELVWLSQHSTTEIFSVVSFEGARKVRRNVTHYNLDAILSAGYRVSLRNATLFRRWATAVLKVIESTLASKH
ncbi:MAG: virulence RhuM family protein [Bacteroidales bacterium]|nr:virulence RhuM family protein [Bacteroidales bacterium]